MLLNREVRSEALSCLEHVIEISVRKNDGKERVFTMARCPGTCKLSSPQTASHEGQRRDQSRLESSVPLGYRALVGQISCT
jgi:hypothetical protein